MRTREIHKRPRCRTIRFFMSNKLARLLTFTQTKFTSGIPLSWNSLVPCSVVRPKIKIDPLLYFLGYLAVFTTAFVAYWLFERASMFLIEYAYNKFITWSRADIGKPVEEESIASYSDTREMNRTASLNVYNIYLKYTFTFS